MQLKQIARDALLKPLQAVSGIVERRHTLPILANVLLEHRDGRLYVTATDLEMQITAHSELRRQGSAGGDRRRAQAAGPAAGTARRRRAEHRRNGQPDDATRRPFAVQPADAAGGRLSAHRRRPGAGAGADAAAARTARAAEVRRVRDGAAGHPLLPQRHAARHRQGLAAGGGDGRPSAVVGEHRHRGRLSAPGSDPAAQDGARARASCSPTPTIR